MKNKSIGFALGLSAIMVLILSFQNCSTDIGKNSPGSSSSAAGPNPSPSPAPNPGAQPNDIPGSAIVNIVADPNQPEVFVPYNTNSTLRVIRFAGAPGATQFLTDLRVVNVGAACPAGLTSHQAFSNLCVKFEPAATASQFASYFSIYNRTGLTNIGTNMYVSFRGRGMPATGIVAVDAATTPGFCSPFANYDSPMEQASGGAYHVACLKLGSISASTNAVVDATTVATAASCPAGFQDAGGIYDVAVSALSSIKLCVKYGTYAQAGKVLTHIAYGAKIDGTCADGDIEIGSHASGGGTTRLCARY